MLFQCKNMDLLPLLYFHTEEEYAKKIFYYLFNTLDLEENFGLYKDFVYKKFSKDVLRSKKLLLNFIKKIKLQKMSIVGKSFPARASTLLNFYGITNKQIPYIAEQPTSLKLGHYLPVSNIPIVNSKILMKERPNYVLILAWHLWKPIVKKWKNRGLKTKFIIPLPKFKIV